MAHQEILSLTLKQLRYAVAAADAGNVTQAAESLHVSQPSISVAIAQIEAHYGRKLFVRHKGEGVELTSFGARPDGENAGLPFLRIRNSYQSFFSASVALRRK